MEALERTQEPKATLDKVGGLERECQVLKPSPVVFVCTAALAILDRMDLVDKEMMGWWLSERQLPNGGLNGRPEKLEDVREKGDRHGLELTLLVGMLQLVGPVGNVYHWEARLDRPARLGVVHSVVAGTRTVPF